MIARSLGCYPGTRGCISHAELATLLERLRQAEGPGQEQAAAPKVNQTSPWVAPQSRYLPPPTAQDQIMPEYRDRSVVRPEFRDSGTPMQ